jgi:hypothetical protein
MPVVIAIGAPLAKRLVTEVVMAVAVSCMSREILHRITRESQGGTR